MLGLKATIRSLTDCTESLEKVKEFKEEFFDKMDEWEVKALKYS